MSPADYRESGPGMGEAPIWQPDPARVAGTAIDHFRRDMVAKFGPLRDTRELHSWSVAEPESFWTQVFERAVMVGDGPGEVPISAGDTLSETRFFPTARLSYAENLLAGGERPGADPVAIVYRTEGETRREITWAQLAAAVAQVAELFSAAGVAAGDVVAAWMPNCPETVISMLAANSLGAVFSSTSPDFGADGVVDRFGQVQPKVLVVADGYRYGGKAHARLPLLDQVLTRLPSVELALVVGELAETPDLPALSDVAVRLWPEPDGVTRQAVFAARAFADPGFILFSSGTTGLPKCIIHSAAGLLLKHWTEHALHSDIRAGDRVFYYTTCGWMMWNWLVGALAVGATLVLYDGSPFSPTPEVLWDLASEERCSFFGTSAKYLDACRQEGLAPGQTRDLSALRTVASTGSPLSQECFAYVYRDIGADLHLASISGGTDICGCFVLGDPTRAVFAGEIQGPALGLAVDVAQADGTSLADRPGTQGELICRNAFPSIPLGFLGDTDGQRFQSAYFRGVPGVWTQGDFAEWTSHEGLIISGRSDATLNSGGVRIGTSEIYRQVEALTEVAEGLAIGQQVGTDTRIVLFVRLAAGHRLDASLAKKIRSRLRSHASPRHVPAVILAVGDLPRTRSGKLAELAVSDVVHGREVRNVAALANPESLDAFRGLLTKLS